MPRRRRVNNRRNYNDDRYTSSSEDSEPETEEQKKEREETEKNLAREREENKIKYQRKLESNFDKEFEDLMNENMFNEQIGSVKCVNMLNIKGLKPSKENGTIPNSEGNNGIKMNTMKLLVRGKGNKIEARKIQVAEDSAWDMGKKKEEIKEKEKEKELLDQEVMKSTLALHHQMQNEDNLLSLENKYITVVKKK